MAFRFLNFFRTTLDQPILAADTTIYINSDDGSLLTFGAGDEYRMVLWAGDPDIYEIIDITAEADGVLTVQRGQEGTIARDWAAGSRLEQSPTAAIFEQIVNSLAAVKYEGAATGTNDYTVTVTGSVPVLTNSEEVLFDIPNTNTSGAVRLKVINGSGGDTGWVNVKWPDNTNLKPGELTAGYLVTLKFHNSAWHVMNVTSTMKRISQQNTGPLGNPNILTNGAFNEWNAGTNFNTPASGSAVCDGYYVEYDGTIGAFTLSRQALTLGQTAVPGEPKYFARWDQSAAGSGSTERRFAQKIPGVHTRAGKDVIRKIWLKADTNRTLTAKILQNFGTGGSPSAEVLVASESWTLSTSWQAFDITTVLNSISGKTLGSNDDDGLIFAIDLPVNTTMTIDFAMDQAEPGDISSLHNSSLPLATRHGGLGRSFSNFAALVAAIEATGGPWLTNAEWQAAYPDLTLAEGISTSGLIFRNSTGPAWGARSIAVGTGLSVTNANGTAGDPTVSLGTALDNYNADPLSVAELASITGAFGTAAFVNTGTSGATLGLLNANLTFSGTVDFTNVINMANNIPIRAKESGGTARPILSIDTSNIVQLGATTNALNLRGSAITTSIRPSFNGNTALDSGNGVLASGGTFTGAVIVSSTASNVPLVVDGRAPQTAAYARFDVASVAKGYIGTDGTDIVILSSGAAVLVTFKQSGEVILSSTGPTSAYAAGFRGSPVVSGEKSANYTSVLADAGGSIPFTATATFTIPANSSVAYPVGTIIHLPNLNGGGTLTVHPDTGVTLRRGDGTAGTGDRTVNADSAAWIWKRGTNEWYIYGNFT